MDNKNSPKNMLLAGALILLIFAGHSWAMNYFWPNANKEPVSAANAPAATPAAATAPSGGAVPASQPAPAKDLKTALNPAGRVAIAGPGLTGSINLTGGVIDDLTTNRHTAELDKAKGQERIFAPAGTPHQHFAQFGWTPADGAAQLALPNLQTVWTAPAGARLTPQTPVTLTWNNGAGQTFALTYAIDADYMLTVSQQVSNAGPAPVAVKPIAQLSRAQPRADDKEAHDTFNVHSGPFGAFDGTVNFDNDYSDVAETKQVANKGKTDWVGFTDIYWMSTLIPEKTAASSDFRAMDKGVFLANLFYPQVSVAPGQQSTQTTRLFAGAKESSVLDRYAASGITNFDLAIDWGWFRWFERPLFGLLKWLFGAVGNFGVAIMLLTLIVRTVMFPVAQKQFASMAAMKAIQPKMKAIQDRYKDDRQKQQEEIMALYKKEGVNPLAGCLPIFLQIPVFFALYKVLILSVEMRHQPFALWIKDLSAPDPLHILNLFGYLNFTPPAFLGIGLLAILLGVTSWLTFRLNPATDPVQAQMNGILPWVMMFIMAPFATGLLLYWITSNVLTVAQQSYLYSRHPQLRAQAEKDAARAKKTNR